MTRLFEPHGVLSQKSQALAGPGVFPLACIRPDTIPFLSPRQS